jgi:hypothetical protein
VLTSRRPAGEHSVRGKAVNSFLVNGLNGSLDGEYFSQDRATVLAGRLPPQGSTSTVVLTPMTRSQVRAVIAWQTTLTLLIAVAVGGVLGIAGGRLAWHAFAGSLGIVPIVEVPVAALILGLVALVLAGNLLASLPAAVAARTRPGVSLRTE